MICSGSHWLTHNPLFFLPHLSDSASLLPNNQLLQLLGMLNQRLFRNLFHALLRVSCLQQRGGYEKATFYKEKFSTLQYHSTKRRKLNKATMSLNSFVWSPSSQLPTLSFSEKEIHFGLLEFKPSTLKISYMLEGFFNALELLGPRNICKNNFTKHLV